LSKRVSDLQKEEILNLFINGIDLNQISESYEFSLATIVRQLKNMIGVDAFKKYKLKKKNIQKVQNNPSHLENNLNSKFDNENFEEKFIEVIPITDQIQFDRQKELTSEPITEAKLPEIVYLIVDKKIELVPKLLKDYPEWSYMPEEDLKRVTLEIYADQKNAKKCCSKNEKTIKIPNSKVFIIASKLLKSKGITRVIFNDLLFSL
tara:strand:- start:18 stop:635 length:618 start_codon:yes stop_codon:yes gene_type:complete